MRSVSMAAILLTGSGVALGQTSATAVHAIDARPNDLDHRHRGRCRDRCTGTSSCSDRTLNAQKTAVAFSRRMGRT
jgi:hypothetical protein